MIGEVEFDEENHEIVIHYEPNSKVLSNSKKSFLLASSQGWADNKDKTVSISFNVVKVIPKDQREK